MSTFRAICQLQLQMATDGRTYPAFKTSTKLHTQPTERVQSFWLLGYLRTFFHKTSANYPSMESFVCNAQCAVCTVCLMFSLQPNKLTHILKFISWYIIQHIFVPACSVGRKTWFSRKLWFSNSKFGISGSFWPILSVPKIMLLVPENEKRYKF